MNYLSFENDLYHSKSGNTEFMTYDNANNIVDELFESLFSRYQIGLETSMRGNNFIFDSVQLLRINFESGGSYVDSPDWIKKGKAAINPKNGKNKCFQYGGTVYGEIELWN